MKYFKKTNLYHYIYVFIVLTTLHPSAAFSDVNKDKNCIDALRESSILLEDSSNHIVSLFSGKAVREEQIAEGLGVSIKIVDYKDSYEGISKNIDFTAVDLSRDYIKGSLVRDQVGKSKNILVSNPWIHMADSFLNDRESRIVEKYSNIIYTKTKKTKGNLKKISSGFGPGNPFNYNISKRQLKGQFYKRLMILVNILNVAKSYQAKSGQVLLMSELLNTFVFEHNGELGESMFKSSIYSHNVQEMLNEIYPLMEIKKSKKVKAFLWPKNIKLSFLWGREFTTGWHITFNKNSNK